MPGPLVHVGATVICSHGGQAQPIMPDQRVLVSGMPIVTIASPYIIAGCPFVAPGGNGPCVVSQWLVGATRVLASGQPVVLQSDMSICTPTGTPKLVVAMQTRVTGM